MDRTICANESSRGQGFSASLRLTVFGTVGRPGRARDPARGAAATAALVSAVCGGARCYFVSQKRLWLGDAPQTPERHFRAPQGGRPAWSVSASRRNRRIGVQAGSDRRTFPSIRSGSAPAGPPRLRGGRSPFLDQDVWTGSALPPFSPLCGDIRDGLGPPNGASRSWSAMPDSPTAMRSANGSSAASTRRSAPFRDGFADWGATLRGRGRACENAHGPAPETGTCAPRVACLFHSWRSLLDLQDRATWGWPGLLDARRGERSEPERASSRDGGRAVGSLAARAVREFGRHRLSHVLNGYTSIEARTTSTGEGKKT